MADSEESHHLLSLLLFRLLVFPIPIYQRFSHPLKNSGSSVQINLARLNHGAQAAPCGIERMDSVVLRVLIKEIVPLLPACLVFAIIIRFLARVGNAGEGEKLDEGQGLDYGCFHALIIARRWRRG